MTMKLTHWLWLIVTQILLFDWPRWDMNIRMKDYYVQYATFVWCMKDILQSIFLAMKIMLIINETIWSTCLNTINTKYDPFVNLMCIQDNNSLYKLHVAFYCSLLISIIRWYHKNQFDSKNIHPYIKSF